MKMKILVTGASGLLGREIMKTFEADADVVGLSFSRRRDRLMKVDLRDIAVFRRVLEDVRPDMVVHSAAYRDPDLCEEDRDAALRLNVEPIRVLCEELPSAVRIVLISSDYVFDGENPPYTEESVRCPVNFYGETKCMAEDILKDREGTLAFRIPVLIGADDSFEKSGFIYRLVSSVRAEEEVFLDDAHIRFPTWTRDVAAALRFALEHRVEGILHFSGLEGGTQYEFAHKTAKLLGVDSLHISPTRNAVVRNAARPLNSRLSSARIQSLGFDGFTPFLKVLEIIIDEIKT